MAGRQAAQPDFMGILESQEAFDVIRDRDYVKCVVVDLHLSWCGPCEVMKPNFRTMFFGIDEVEKRLEIYTMCSEFITDKAILDHIGEQT